MKKKRVFEFWNARTYVVRGANWPTAVGVAGCVVGVAALGHPPGALADATGVVAVMVSDDPTDPASACDDLLGKDVDVCNVYVEFDNPVDKLHVIGFANVATDSPSGFVQISALEGGADTAPSDLAVQTNPALACDTHVTVGLRTVPSGMADCSSLAPDFDMDLFNTAGQAVGSWYCNNPPSNQGNPTAESLVLVAQFTVPAGASVSGEITVLYNTGATKPLVAAFDCAPAVCPTPPLDLGNFQDFHTCLSGPGDGVGGGCECWDYDADDDVDLLDFGRFQAEFGDFRRSSESLAFTAVAQVDNPCVPDVYSQFFALDRHGDAMGFYLGLFSGDTKCLDDCDPCFSHYQGIVRKPGAGTPFFYVSKNNGPEVLVVQMGSRDTNGERLRSNRLAHGFTTAFTNPAFGDGEIATADFPYFEFLDAFYGFDHVGGMQAIGDTLVASVEGGGEGAVVFLDISNPAFPMAYHTRFFPHPNGSNAIARLDDGRYLLLASGGGHFVYVSNVTDLRDQNLFFQFVGELNVSGAPFGYNHISLVKQCDGELYVVGTDRFVGSCAGPLSTAALWRVDLGTNVNVPGSVSVTHLGSIDLNCNNIGEGVTCDFRAAGGTYVSPSGELIIYGTVHQRGDPFTAFAEFRRRDVVHPDAQPWVQLYSDPLGWNSSFGQSRILDMPDRYKDDYLNFGWLDFFDNSASSVRWWAPVGCCMELIANPCSAGNTGAVHRLEGTGQVESINNLATTAFGDNRASAVRFCFDAVEPYGCNQPVSIPSPKCQGCPADVNNDCYVDMSDLAELLARWGEGDDAGDINSDGVVNVLDLAQLLGGWGPCYDGPDLVISEINADACLNVGQSIGVTFELSNIGIDPAFGFMDVGFSLSIDDNPHNSGDDIPMGILHLNLNPPLQPGHSRTYSFNTLAVPIGATPTLQNLFVCADLGLPPCGAICEGCEPNNCRSVDVRIGLADLAVTELAYPSPVISGDLVPVTATIRNFGCDTVCTTVTCCLGVGQGSNCATQSFCIEPMETDNVTCMVLAPLSPLNCGATDQFSVSACVNFFDVNGGNNCRNETIGITERYWDIDLAITSGDNSVGLGDTFSYNVEVTNLGNMPSPSCVAFITGINCSAGPGQWGCVLKGDPFTPIGIVQPGQANSKTFTFEFTIPSCCVPPIIIGQQWLKAEILYTQGENCDDDCGEGFGNNLHQEPIQVTR